MKHLKTYEKNGIIPKYDKFGHIDGNIIQDEPKPEEEEIDGNKYIYPKEHGDEETGTVKNFFKEKGFGFIIGDTTGENFFTNGYHSIDNIQTGDRVKFVIKRSKSSKNDKATKVTLL